MISRRHAEDIEPKHDDAAEDLGDRARDALGEDADCVESVEILAQIPCAQLPPQALQRLGARRDQKNMLLKVVLRHLERTLTNHEANVLRDRIYTAVHRGGTRQWAATSGLWPADPPGRQRAPARRLRAGRVRARRLPGTRSIRRRGR
jgi:hypothetical protein